MTIVVTARVLLIDLDGTLVDTTEAVESTWRALAAELGIAFEQLEPFIHGIPADQVLATALPQLPTSTRLEIADRLQAQQADADHPAVLLPGARRLLEHLPPRDWAIVTSGDVRLATSSMTKANIADPPVMITADDVARGKPDPAPYLAAAARLGAQPRDCLVIEDSPAGIASGHAASMRVLAVQTTYPARALESADWLVPSLEAVTLQVSATGFTLQLDNE
jgi:sugar-phosphatase